MIDTILKTLRIKDAEEEVSCHCEFCTEALELAKKLNAPFVLVGVNGRHTDAHFPAFVEMEPLELNCPDATQLIMFASRLFFK